MSEWLPALVGAVCMALGLILAWLLQDRTRGRVPDPERLAPSARPPITPLPPSLEDIRRRAQDELLAKQHQTVLAEALNKLLQGQAQLLQQQEPTEDQVRQWLTKRGAMAVSPEGAAGYCATHGWVLIRTEQWEQLMQAMGKRGMSVQEWIERKDDA